MRTLESDLKGSHFYENACLITSEESAQCTTGFYVYSIEAANPLLRIVGDGYLGLGLSDPGH